jgi:hypothetical protein
MAYHIDTLPLWEAFRQGGECPLCTLESGLETQYLDQFLGGSVMEPDTRVAVNAEGFCPRHGHGLFEADKKLPLALMMHTRLTQVMEQLDPLINKAAEPPAQKRKKNEPDPAQILSEAAARVQDSCIICRRMADVMDRYEETLLVMWHREAEFRTLFEEGKGFCLRHFGHLVDQARKPRLFTDHQPFLKALCLQQQKALARLEEEIKWFTLKFDYRNSDKPWGTSRDALPRTMEKLSGYTVDMPK